MKGTSFVWASCALLATFGLAATGAEASNITVSDGYWNPSSTNSWYNSAQEDQEVEPGMVYNQSWDLEAFDLDGFSLAVIGGYDFKNGKDNFDHGDIFIDLDGHIYTGSTPGGNQTVANTFGFDYVIDIDFSDFTYDVLALDGNSQVRTVYYPQNNGSNPWLYASGGTAVAGFQDLSFTYQSGQSDTAISSAFGYDLLGGSHNIMSGFDLSFLGYNTTFFAHTTMQCGNDNLIGMGTTPVPEPATSLLLLTGLAGLTGAARRRRK